MSSELDYSPSSPDTSISLGVMLWLVAMMIAVAVCIVGAIVRAYIPFHWAWLLWAYPLMILVGVVLNLIVNPRK